MSALVAAARWVAEGRPGELPKEAQDQLRQLVEQYEAEIWRLDSTPAAERLDRSNQA